MPLQNFLAHSEKTGLVYEKRPLPISWFLSYHFHNWKQIPVLFLTKTQKLRVERDLLWLDAGLGHPACSLVMYILLKINCHCIPCPLRTLRRLKWIKRDLFFIIALYDLFIHIALSRNLSHVFRHSLISIVMIFGSEYVCVHSINCTCIMWCDRALFVSQVLGDGEKNQFL